MDSNEEWKSIDGYEGVYEVSSLGRVRRIAGGAGARIGHILSLGKTVTGYPQVSLCKNGKPKKVLVHRLVAKAFLGSPKQGREVNHRNGNKKDNRVENLEWVSHARNIRHAYRVLGRTMTNIRPRGEENGHSKLTRDDVIQIRRLYSTRDYTQRALGKMFGVTAKAISAIVLRKNWKHVAPSPGDYSRDDPHPNAKLTRDDVEKIRQLYATGNYSYQGLGKVFGVNAGSVFDIVHHKTWKHVP